MGLWKVSSSISCEDKGKKKQLPMKKIISFDLILLVCLFHGLILVGFGLLLNKSLENSADDFKLSSLAQSFLGNTIFSISSIMLEIF